MDDVMTYEEIVDAIVAFNNDPDIHQLMNIYYNQNIAEIFAVSRRELSHSSFLAWLFTTSANHSIGSLPIIQFLELYILKSREQHKKCISDSIYTSILSRNIQILDCQAVTEDFVKVKELKGRADIVLNCDYSLSEGHYGHLKIVIENKVYSDEHSHQTVTYYEYYNQFKTSRDEILYIYLTPPAVKKDAECPHFVHITYQDLLEHVLDPLSNHPDLSQRTSFILNEYINCLSVPSEIVDERNGLHIQTSILAVGMKEKELLQKFWEKYDKLILASINAYAIASGDENVRRLSENLNKRDTSKYSVNGEGRYCKNRMVEAVVNHYLKTHKGVTISELKQIFPDKLQGSLGIIRDETDTIKDMSRFFESNHPETGQVFFICNQWGHNTGNFIDYVNDSIKEITIEKL